MAHLNLYLADDLAARLKRESNDAGLTLSKYVLSRLSDGGTTGEWPRHYFDHSCGFLTEDIADPTDPLPEPLELELPV